MVQYTLVSTMLIKGQLLFERKEQKRTLLSSNIHHQLLTYHFWPETEIIQIKSCIIKDRQGNGKTATPTPNISCVCVYNGSFGLSVVQMMYKCNLQPLLNAVSEASNFNVLQV
jgi:hypothetical protein